MTYAYCPRCVGAGGHEEEVVVGEVSRDMALDACEPGLQGQPITAWERVICPDCDGRGFVPAPDAEHGRTGEEADD